MKKIFAAMMFMLVPFVSVNAHHHHDNLVGTYQVNGVDPVTGPYTGTAVITRTGDVYQGTWTFDGDPTTEPNTGIIVDDVISFVYFFDGTTYGVSSYEIHDHGKFLEGKYVDFGSTQSGRENLTKIFVDDLCD